MCVTLYFIVNIIYQYISANSLFVNPHQLPENDRLAGKRKRKKRKEKGKNRSANEADQSKHKHCGHDQKRDLKLRCFLDRPCVSVSRRISLMCRASVCAWLEGEEGKSAQRINKCGDFGPTAEVTPLSIFSLRPMFTCCQRSSQTRYWRVERAFLLHDTSHDIYSSVRLGNLDNLSLFVQNWRAATCQEPCEHAKLACSFLFWTRVMPQKQLLRLVSTLASSSQFIAHCQVFMWHCY